MAPLFDYSPPQTILLSRTSMSPPSRTIFNAYRTTSLWPGIDTPRPRRNRQCMLTGNDGRNWITRLGTRFIWKQKTYVYGSSKKEEVPSFTLVTLDRLNFQG